MNVLITGGTGTLGQALVSELLYMNADRICVYSRDEHKQAEMREAFPDPRKKLRWFIGDVRDPERLRRAFHGLDCVIHAAAMKRVEVSEANPFEAVQTNIIGSQNVAEAALDCGVPKVLAISTDKAHAPTTLYGATKLCAERMFIAWNAYAGRSSTRFSVVRFGNIAMSRGSVLPKWLALIEAGAADVPVTDPDCTRYWITARDAARHAIDCVRTMQGGESFLPVMPAFRVADLAAALGVKMRVVGLGPGERLHEDGSENARRLTISELRELIG